MRKLRRIPQQDTPKEKSKLQTWLAIALMIVLAITIFTGCSSGGGDGDDSCIDIQYAYTTEQFDNETGLLLRPTVDEISNSYAYISFEEMVAEYKDVEACVANAQTPGPSIYFTSFNHFGFRLELALYNYANDTAYIDVDVEEWLPTRSCISDREFLRHEFVHHILDLNGADFNANRGHTHPAFVECSALGPKSCNGQYCD